jgi:DNA invertase Pin-like site-specific DNA recombinase
VSVWAGYRRVSRVGDRDDTLISPELQAAEIERYAGGRKLDVEMLEPELDVSGGKIEPADPRAQVVDGVKDGRYAGIIVADIDRLSRLSLIDALQLIERIEGAGGQVISVAQNFDPGTPEGRWGRNIWLSTTHMQLERYGANFRRAKASSVERGVWPLPIAPLGYSVTRRRDGGDGILRPTRRAAGRRGVPDARRREAAVRDRRPPRRRPVAPRQDHPQPRLPRRDQLRGRVNPAAHEPLVDVALFEAAQLDHPRPPRGIHPGALLAGLVRCAGCQRRMTPNNNKGKGERIYRCHPRNARGRCQAARDHLAGQARRLRRAHLLRPPRPSRAPRPAVHRRARRRRARAPGGRGRARRYQQVTRVGDVGAEHFMEGMRSRVAAVTAARERVGRLRAVSSHGIAVEGLRAVYERAAVEGRRHVLRSSLSAVWVRKGAGPCPTVCVSSKPGTR